ncbi:MAG: class I SAM-dependent methyltransferase [Patescibacteria group bacterium]|nr:class I SAM-dependent methyltransferase [Patescibacteria group bacterium]
MSIPEYIASQLRKPNGFIGRVLISRILNKANAKMNNVTLSSLELKDSDRVLEVGFGGGALLTEMARLKSKAVFYGADFSQDMVALCQKRMHGLISEGRLKLDCASVENLPYETETFTKICSVNTIYFWEDCNEAIKELKRVLKKNGILVLTFGDKVSMSEQTVTNHGFNLYTSLEVQQVMEEEGFTNIQIKQGQDSSGSFYSLTGAK